MSIFTFLLFGLLFLIVNAQTPKLLIMSIDSFRYDYIEYARNQGKILSNLEKFRFQSASALALIPQFPTKTYPNHQTIATGVYPEVHGIVGNDFYDPKLKEVFSGEETQWKNPNWFDVGVEPIWVTNSKAGTSYSPRISGLYMWPSSTSTYNDYSPDLNYFVPFNKTIPLSERITTVLGWFTNKLKPVNLALLYYSRLDEIGHKYTPSSKELLDELVLIDQEFGKMMQQLDTQDSLKDLNVILLSDHGMSEVNLLESKNIIDLSNLINSSLYLATSGPYVDIWSKTGVNDTWLLDELLWKVNQYGASVEVLTKETLASKYNYGHSSARLSSRIAPIILMPRLGSVVRTPDTSNSYNATRSSKTGVHGYPPELKEMQGIFMARGPFFKGNYTSKQPVNNIELFEIFCYLLGLRHSCPPNNGTRGKMDEFVSSDVIRRGSVLNVEEPHLVQISPRSKNSSEPEDQTANLLVYLSIVLVLGIICVIMLCSLFRFLMRARATTQRNRRFHPFARQPQSALRGKGYARGGHSALLNQTHTSSNEALMENEEDFDEEDGPPSMAALAPPVEIRESSKVDLANGQTARFSNGEAPQAQQAMPPLVFLPAQGAQAQDQDGEQSAVVKPDSPAVLVSL